MNPKVIDLSMEIYHEAPTFAFDPKCCVLVHNTVESIGYNITQISMSTHQGTHLDAPYHFLNDGMTVDKLPLDQMVGDAIKINLSHKKPKEAITVQDILPYEKDIQKGARVVLQTGWDKVFPDKKYFSDFPYLSLELAKWFAEREIALLGLDSPTPNPTDWLEIHHILLGKNIIVVEGLANLAAVEKDHFMLIALPLKIKGRDGSPIRACAVVHP